MVARTTNRVLPDRADVDGAENFAEWIDYRAWHACVSAVWGCAVEGALG